MTAWAPWTVEDTETLEKVQKRAVKAAVSGLRSQTYEERLVERRLPRLSERRREMDMVQTYKMVNWENGEQIFESECEERYKSDSWHGQPVKKAVPP